MENGTLFDSSSGYTTETITIPMGDPSGTWILTATGIAADGNLRLDSAVITIAPP